MGVTRWLGASMSLASVISKEEIIFVISLIITVLNLYLEYLQRKRPKEINTS